MSELRKFVSASAHSGNPQDDYNKMDKVYPLSHLKEEAQYILEGQDHYNGVYNITKKPINEVAVRTTNVWDFIRDKEKVLILHKEGTFSRYNFCFYDQFPDKFKPYLLINLNATGLAVTGDLGVQKDANAEVYLVALESYALPSSVTVTMDGETLTADSGNTENDYSYDSTTGKLLVREVTGDISITAIAVLSE